MARCCVCRLPVADSPFVTCSECSFSLHFGTCAGITEETFTSKRKKHKKTWKCDTCRSGRKPTGTAESPKHDSTLLATVLQIETKLDALLPLSEKMDSFEVQMQFLSDKFDEFQNRLTAQDKTTKQLTKRVERLENTKVDSDVAQLRQDLDDLEWRSRRLNLELHGLAESQDEDLLSKVNEIAEKLELRAITKDDITAVHRLPAKPGKIRPVIIRFVQQSLRDAWLSKKKVLHEDKKNQFMCENMTRLARTLLTATKEWAKKSGYEYVWYTNGKVLIRKKTGDSAIVIRREDDLAEL